MTVRVDARPRPRSGCQINDPRVRGRQVQAEDRHLALQGCAEHGQTRDQPAREKDRALAESPRSANRTVRTLRAGSTSTVDRVELPADQRVEEFAPPLGDLT
jgi:hypothetical protein